MRYSFYYQSGDIFGEILSGPHNFKGPWVRHGFKVRNGLGLAGIVRLRDWIMYYVYECALK